MHILIVGNMGYVGPVVSRHLRARFPDAHITGYDSGLFAHCLTGSGSFPETVLDFQYFRDVRDCTPDVLRGVDAVIYLAAISNDPMGQQFEAVTDAVNRQGCLSFARMAADAGVRHFALASSCSVYGLASSAPRTEQDATNPLTAYARSKIAAEEDLASLKAGGMTITCLRFATACGFSERLRLDLVLNDFVATALRTGVISVLSDGTPWRPLIHVADMARLLEWAITRTGQPYLVINGGSDGWNYTVRDLAEAVANRLPGTDVRINRDAPPDKRSYRVSFSLLEELAPDHLPHVTLTQAIDSLIDGIRTSGINFSEENVSRFIRLGTLRTFLENGALASDLRWTDRPEPAP